MSDDRHHRRIKRYSPGERTNHWIIAFTFIPVSYTHLDVYKRQRSSWPTSAP